MMHRNVSVFLEPKGGEYSDRLRLYNNIGSVLVERHFRERRSGKFQSESVSDEDMKELRSLIARKRGIYRGAAKCDIKVAYLSGKRGIVIEDWSADSWDGIC